MKKIICACIDQLIQFGSLDEEELFLKELDSKNQCYKVEHVLPMLDGTVQLRIKRQYNSNVFPEV